MKQGPIPGVNIAHNTASGGYQGGELVDDSLRRAGPSKLRTTRYRGFTHGWGWNPLMTIAPPNPVPVGTVETRPSSGSEVDLQSLVRRETPPVRALVESIGRIIRSSPERPGFSLRAERRG